MYVVTLRLCKKRETPLFGHAEHGNTVTDFSLKTYVTFSKNSGYGAK